jgi:hypothetical protein
MPKLPVSSHNFRGHSREIPPFLQVYTRKLELDLSLRILPAWSILNRLWNIVSGEVTNWTHGLELWGWTSKSHIAKMQRSQSKILRMITDVPLYVTDQTLHDDLEVPFIKDVIQEKSINHHDKLENHSNPILRPPLEQQQRRRLKKLWPADLIDGWRGFTHWRGPHHDTVGTGGRCLTQHKP